MINPLHPKKIKWYRFRKRTDPVVWPISYYFRPFTESGHVFPKIETVAHLLVDGRYDQTLIDDASFRAAQRWLLRRPGVMLRQLSRSCNFAQRWLAWCRIALNPRKLRHLSNVQLARLYSTFQKQYEHYSLDNIYYWIVAGDALIEELDRKLKKVVPDNKKRRTAMLALTMPDILSFIETEETELLRLAARFHRLSAARQQVLLARHSKRFGWIPWDYVGPSFWTPNQIRQRIKAYSSEKAKSELRNRTKFRQQTRRDRSKFLSYYRISKKVQALAAATRAQAILQDGKKSTTTEAHYWLHFLHQEASYRLRMPRLMFYLVSFDEIKSALRNISPLPDVKHRTKGLVNIISNGAVTTVTGALAKRWLKVLGESNYNRERSRITGTIASTGTARGTVRVMLSARDARKVKEGDILVAMMTTPEHVQAMKKAGAFVTDEGGLTSHAAIIAREMKKPCIIGTKIATKVLKDGDKVEVDAVKGVVRKI